MNDFRVVGDCGGMIEGFKYKTYPPDLVKSILIRYLADTTLEKLSIDLSGVSVAGAQRVVEEAVKLGVIAESDKHKRGGGFARKRARVVWEKYPKEKPAVIARLAGCGVSTAYRAKK